MKRWLIPILVAVAILAVGVLAAVNSKDSSGDSGDSDDTKNTASHSRKHDGDRGGRVKADENGDKGHGPPSWAHSQKGKHDKAAREEWRRLTPEQRRDFMDKLIREHTEAMQEWGDCVAADRDDCVMPMPPGLAKRR